MKEDESGQVEDIGVSMKPSERTEQYRELYSQFGTLTKEEAEEELEHQYLSDDERRDYIARMTTKPIDLTPVRELCEVAGLKQRFDPQMTILRNEYWEIEKGEYPDDRRNVRVALEGLRGTDLGYIGYVATFINGDLAFTDNRPSLDSFDLEDWVEWVKGAPSL